jgi:integrase/recombinase XerD
VPIGASTETRPALASASLGYTSERCAELSGVAHRLGLAVEQAAATCPSLRGRRTSPHTLRHTTAMHLLQAGVELTVIALWLGHESPTTTHRYVEADLAMKRRALAALTEPSPRKARFRPSDRVLAFLEGL